MTKIVGLTGGIGSGKTTVAKMFLAREIPVYIADDEAKKLMESHTIINKVERTFGTEIVTNKKINRTKLASLVFKNPEKLKLLNKIIHPAVQKHFNNWLKNHNTVPFVIKEAAILFETGGYKKCDKIITVVAPKSLRVQRVIQRDKTDEYSVLNRINNQWSDEKKILLSDFVIENVNLKKTESQVLDILKELNKI